MTNMPVLLLTELSDVERNRALLRFQALRPHLENGVPIALVAQDHGILIRTARRWVTRYRNHGLPGLARKERADRRVRRLSAKLQKVIEGLALQKPCPSVATIHRKATEIAKQFGESIPSYTTVYRIVRQMQPALLTMALKGSKGFSDRYDLVHRTEASGPNAIWQADHTELDILVKDDQGKPRRPWLTIILDDYSRAVAGYMLSFSAPSAIQTALALRQAIWRKSDPGWHVCGIPEVLYTDHGSDFTSHHIEQVSADLRIQVVFSTIGQPRGRGKIERFFNSLSQVFLSRLPGYSRSEAGRTAVLKLPELTQALERYLIDEYHVTPHRSTGQPPQARWESSGFLPHMPVSLEQLDLLLLTVPKTRRVQQDGIQFKGLRFIDPTLAAYVGEEVLLRYDPRDIAEISIATKNQPFSQGGCGNVAG